MTLGEAYLELVDAARAAAIRSAKLKLAPLGLNLRILLDEQRLSMDTTEDLL